jgi:hypothetical protein
LRLQENNAKSLPPDLKWKEKNDRSPTPKEISAEWKSKI